MVVQEARLAMYAGGHSVASVSMRGDIGIRGLLQCASAQVQWRPSQKLETPDRAGCRV